MPDLLLELFSEEIPARMQRQAAEDLKKLVTNALVERGLVYEGAASYATPRRLALQVVGLPGRQPDVREERKGPRVGAPEAAIAGFLKSAGLASLDEARIEKDKKGAEFYLAIIERAGGATIDVLAEILPAIVKSFPWPKSMRWGAASASPESLRWVRPLHSIVATFGIEGEAPDIVPFEVDGVRSGDVTRGHRFMAPAPIHVKRFDDYVSALEKAKVVLDAERRRDIILHDAKDLAFAQGLELIEDAGLLEEVGGLVEWPVVLMGKFDESFLAIPPEVIRATIRVNQKCFVLRKQDGSLANRFLLTSNIEATDGGATVIGGNERVIAARLSDAKFFYETDLKTRLEDRLQKLESIVFHAKLGTQRERVDRIVALAKELAPIVGADPERAARAALLCKADLVTEMVGEFPELQGLMGSYYAKAQNEDPSVAEACYDHYKPQGQGDRVPKDPVSIAVALADKLDTLAMLFWAKEIPTGSKDPFALRRAALGVIRIALENEISFSIKEKLHFVLWNPLSEWDNHYNSIVLISDLVERPVDEDDPESKRIWGRDYQHVRSPNDLDELKLYEHYTSIALVPADLAGESGFEERGYFERFQHGMGDPVEALELLMNFFIDRLKVYLRDKGARYDLIDAALGAVVLSEEGAQAAGASLQDDLLMITHKVEALTAFLGTDDGENLLAGYKRAINILKAEEKKDGAGAYDKHHAPNLRIEPPEHKLAAAIARAREESGDHLKSDEFAGALHALSKLREPVDDFFDKVTVNADNKDLRLNRLRLLNELRVVMNSVADFGQVSGAAPSA